MTIDNESFQRMVDKQCPAVPDPVSGIEQEDFEDTISMDFPQ
jgi:hypothetical protein